MDLTLGIANPVRTAKQALKREVAEETGWTGNLRAPRLEWDSNPEKRLTVSMPEWGQTSHSWRDVRIFDGVGVIAADSVRVHDGRIAELGTVLVAAPDDSVVDGAGMTLLPRFVDGHTHTPPDRRHAERALRQALAFGVTTVICLSTDPDAARTMKDLAAQRSDLADGEQFDRAGHRAAAVQRVDRAGT